MADVIEKAKELGEALMQDERVRRMQIARAANDGDAALQALIGEFNLLRLRLKNEMEKQPPDGEKCKDYEKQMKELYPKIMENGSMAEYTASKEAVDEVLAHINTILQMSVSGEVDSSGCGGNCEGCSGCH